MNSELNSIASGHSALDELFQTKDYTDYKWINPKEIIVSQWARMKCMFGCGEYGNNASCPPNVPSVAECEKFFHEYSDAVIFRSFFSWTAAPSVLNAPGKEEPVKNQDYPARLPKRLP